MRCKLAHWPVLNGSQPLAGSDWHGLQNPCGLRVGYGGVGVRVCICEPWVYPYPQNGFRVTRAVTRHIGDTPHVSKYLAVS
jgi:hypothetical protein